MPIARPRGRGGQLTFETEWTGDRVVENTLVNDVRQRVGRWRSELRYGGTTQVTADLLASIVRGTEDEPRLRPILRTYEPEGSTRWVDFDTTRPVWPTSAEKCHVTHVVADTGSWEQKTAQALEAMPEVRAHVKNHNVGFTIPYTLAGEERQYVPDFLVRLDDGRGDGDLLNLILEVTGEKKKDKAAKVATARTLWVPAVNGHGGLGRWAFLEVASGRPLAFRLAGSLTAAGYCNQISYERNQ